MNRLLLTFAATFLLVALQRTAEGQSATIESDIQCNQLCTIQVWMNGEIASDTIGALETLIGQVHQSADRLHKQLGMSTLHIDSPGGSVAAAMAIGRLIRKENMQVSVGLPSKSVPVRIVDRCISACVLILAGGVERSFYVIGIHRPYLEVPAQEVNATFVQDYYGEMLEQIRSYFREMNVSERLADTMLRIAPEDIQYITYKDAKAYGLVEIDPVFQETLDLKEAQMLGLDRREYNRRKALVDESCRHLPDDPVASERAFWEWISGFKQWSACKNAILQTGSAPMGANRNLDRHGGSGDGAASGRR
jgi:hypothetical protein